MKYRDHVTLNEVVRRAITSGVLKIITLYDSVWNSKMAALVQIDSISFRLLFVLVVSLPCIKSFSFDLQNFICCIRCMFVTPIATGQAKNLFMYSDFQLDTKNTIH